MAEYFHFLEDDEFITKSATAEEIGDVTVWQATNLNYEYSFHTMHDAGWPVYIIESGQRGQRNRPKINVKDPGTRLTMVGKYMPAALVQADSLAVVAANLELFQKLTKDYYEGVEVAETVAETWLVEWTCGTSNCKRKSPPRKILQEIAAADRALLGPWFVEHRSAALGKCKICKQANWTFSEVRARVKDEALAVTLSDTEPKKQV